METVYIELKGLFGSDRTHVSKASPVPRALLYLCSVILLSSPFLPFLYLNLLCTSVHILAFFSHWGNCNNLLTGVHCSNFSHSVLNCYLLYPTSNELSLEYKIVESFLFFLREGKKLLTIFGSMVANEFWKSSIETSIIIKHLKMIKYFLIKGSKLTLGLLKSSGHLWVWVPKEAY